MNLKRCENGHFYDEEKYSVCPHCSLNLKPNGNDIGSNANILFHRVRERGDVNLTKRIILNLVKWSIQTVLFSLIPLFFLMLVHWMFQIEEVSLDEYISELCPFTLVVSSSIAMELAKKKYRNTSIKEVVFPAYLILLILFFMLYGATVVSFQLEIPLEREILKNIFYAVLLISIIHLIIGALLQILGGFYDE